MTSRQLALWVSEPCDTAPAPVTRARAADSGEPVRLVTTDHGRPAGRPFPWGRPVADIPLADRSFL